ncbi:MAG: class I SAM-dependent rRNA methyltransferase [Spirochaetaceae bacterium]|nr:MAG: class I SAM-dependent rRNA methyltransferase [Spirochaetaceae bacterium]
MRAITLHLGKEKQTLRRHPWVLPRAVDRVEGSGDVACVRAADGRFIAWGWYDERAHTPVRLLSWDESAEPDSAWVAGTVRAAVARRGPTPPDEAVRLVFGEADGLPGVAADRYADTVIVQLGTKAAIDRRAAIATALLDATGARRLRAVTDPVVGPRDRLERVDEWIAGEPPEGPVEFVEGNLRFAADLTTGQKTGFYLDQRTNREIVGKAVGKGLLLDAFSYSGGFACAATDAEAVCVDSAEAAGPLVARNAALNRAGGRVSFTRADVFDYLRTTTERFDAIVLDPPKMARGERDVPAALRAYKDLVLHALGRLQPAGLLFVFSCAAAIGWQELSTACAWGALDARREIRSIGWLSQSGDHPVLSSFPDSHYLRGIVWRAD